MDEVGASGARAERFAMQNETHGNMAAARRADGAAGPDTGVTGPRPWQS